MARTASKDVGGHSFEDYFKRATSPLLVLHLLNEEPMYGYKMTQELKKRSNAVYNMSFLYPVLYRLQEQGFVTEFSKEINHRLRNYYAITDIGRDYLEQLKVKYQMLLVAVEDIMNSSSTPGSETEEPADELEGDSEALMLSAE